MTDRLEAVKSYQHYIGGEWADVKRQHEGPIRSA